MNDLSSNVFASVLFISIVVMSFFVGEAMSERRACKQRGGVYSFDFMECMKNEVVK
jgi:hypothetical protein